jgi:oligopeptide/dipeptide ABC transporter ATP-binding protein
MSDRLAVIYAGKIVETGPAARLTANPSHPYTRVLLDAVPATRPSERRTEASRPLAETVTAERTACPFAPRCPRRADLCLTDEPGLEPRGESLVACHFPLNGTAPLQASTASARTAVAESG